MNKIVLVSTIALLLLGFTSMVTAPEGELPTGKTTTIEYKDANMTIEFKEDGIKIGQAILKSHKTYDEIKEITSGKDRIVVWYEFSGFQNIKENALVDVEFIDMRKQIVDETDLNIEDRFREPRLVSNPDYLQPINKDYNFVYLKDGEWLLYNFFDIPKENITLGVQTDLFWGEFIDVRLVVLENKLDRHALVLGTNCGLVTEAPTDDPGGSDHVWDNSAKGFKVTTSSAVTITEMGWWCDTASEEANFEVGIYSHDAINNNPEELLFVERTNAKGTTSGWKGVTGLNWSLDSSTTYWLLVQLDNTSTATYGNYQNSVGDKWVSGFAMTTLPNPWTYISSDDVILAIYAVWEAGAPPPESTCNPPASGCWEIDNGDDCTIDDTNSLAGAICIQDGTLTITSTGTVNIPTGNEITIKNLAGNWINIEDGGSIQIEE